jgi:hypothetical protein
MAETLTLTRRAFSRLLAVAPVASVPVAIAAAPRSLDDEIADLTDQLSEKIRQRWPDVTVTRYPYSEKGCAFLLTALRPIEAAA